MDGITIGSKLSRFTRRAVYCECNFIRFRHMTHSRAHQQRYIDMYSAVLFYMQINITGRDQPLMLAYVQIYDHFNTDGMVEQHRIGEQKMIDVSDIRCLIGQFECTGSQARGNAFSTRTWFIDRTRLYKMMMTVTGYAVGNEFDLTDDSDVEEVDDEEDVFSYITDSE